MPMRTQFIGICCALLAMVGCAPSGGEDAPPAPQQRATQSLAVPKNLFEAVHAQDLASVKKFLDQGANVNEQDINGTPLIQLSLLSSSYNISRVLSQRKDLNLGQLGPGRKSTLHLAAQMGDLESLKNIISLVRSDSKWTSSIVDPPSIDKQRALHVAANDKVVEALFAAKDWIDFQIETRDLQGRNTLHTAIAYQRETTLSWLTTNSCDRSRLQWTIERTRSLSPLDRWQSPLNQKDNEGQSPLILAAKMGDLKSVMSLLQCPYVSVFAQDRNDRNVVHWAAQQDSFAVLDYLMTTINQLEKENASRRWLVRLFLDDPGSWNVGDKWGNTPLHYAALNSDYRFYDRMIREFGADPDQMNNQGQSPKFIFTCRMNKAAGIRNETLARQCANIPLKSH